MGYIKEPAGVAFIVEQTPLTNADRKKISEIIAFYKATGRKMPLAKSHVRHSRKFVTGKFKFTGKKVVA